MAIRNRLTVILAVLCATNALTDFGFPEVEEDASQKNADNKKPVYLPTQCNENELFYPGDAKGDYVCDCKAGYIYHPKTDRCYSAYRQGPCPVNHFLIVPQGQYIPECLPNRCNEDGLVTFKRRCHRLHEAGPCELAELSYVVAVNSNSLELECIQQNLELVSRNPEEEYGMGCLPGTKRSIQGKCEKVIFD
jgi:hypothetical protein